ncbi:hypothetical protein I215_11140 [Galbibacter marinus]|uniref:Uncharacterized protein n=1 Tax=Galbibacter marinus TaxID=555500 RepID=K2P148_9FLAO|nr:hypothetical protein I215_11140 [Galbibacter marinus]
MFVIKLFALSLQHTIISIFEGDLKSINNKKLLLEKASKSLLPIGTKKPLKIVVFKGFFVGLQGLEP